MPMQTAISEAFVMSSTVSLYQVTCHVQELLLDVLLLWNDDFQQHASTCLNSGVFDNDIRCDLSTVNDWHAVAFDETIRRPTEAQSRVVCNEQNKIQCQP